MNERIRDAKHSISPWITSTLPLDETIDSGGCQNNWADRARLFAAYWSRASLCAQMIFDAFPLCLLASVGHPCPSRESAHTTWNCWDFFLLSLLFHHRAAVCGCQRNQPTIGGCCVVYVFTRSNEWAPHQKWVKWGMDSGWIADDSPNTLGGL